MAFKGPRHLRVESYLWIGQCWIWTLFCLPKAGRTVWRSEKLWWASSLALAEDSGWPGLSERPNTQLQTHMDTFKHELTAWGANTRSHTQTDRLYEPSLPCNLQRQHGLSPFQKKKSTWSRLRKPNRQADLPSTRCTGSDLFSLHLWLDPFTQTPKALHIFGLGYIHPGNNSEMYCKEICFLASLPHVLFHWALLCFKSGSTSK